MVQVIQWGLCPALKLVNRTMMRDGRSRIALLSSYTLFYHNEKNFLWFPSVNKNELKTPRPYQRFRGHREWVTVDTSSFPARYVGEFFRALASLLLLPPFSHQGCRVAQRLRALASHQFGPGLNPDVDTICRVSLLLGFFPCTPVFSSPLLKNQHSKF